MKASLRLMQCGTNMHQDEHNMQHPPLMLAAGKDGAAAPLSATGSTSNNAAVCGRAPPAPMPQASSASIPPMLNG